MTTWSWIGSNGSFLNAADWKMLSTEGSGSNYDISSGTVAFTNYNASWASFDLDSGGDTPALNLTNTTLGPLSVLTHLLQGGEGGSGAIGVKGWASLQDGIQTGGVGSAVTVNLAPSAILYVMGNSDMIGAGPSANGSFTVNGGAGSVLWNGNGSTLDVQTNDTNAVKINAAVLGHGTIEVGQRLGFVEPPFVSAEFCRSVGAQQTFEYANTGGTTILKIDDPAAFHAPIAGFGPGDFIEMSAANFGSAVYSSGALNIWNQHDVKVAALTLAGSYSLGDFGVSIVGSNTYIGFR